MPGCLRAVGMDADRREQDRFGRTRAALSAGLSLARALRRRDGLVGQLVGGRLSSGRVPHDGVAAAVAKSLAKRAPMAP